MKNVALILTLIIFFIGSPHLSAQESISNSVDWASAPSVLSYMEQLIPKYGKFGSIPKDTVSNAVVSADCLWTNCLDFCIVTNNYNGGRLQIETKFEQVLLILKMDTFTQNINNYNAAIAMMEQIEPFLKIDLGKSVPLPHTLVCLETIHSNDTAEVIQYKTQWNENAISNRTARMLEFKQDQAKRLFYRKLRDFNFLLKGYIEGFPPQ